MILSRTPYRISFAGGGSDLPDFYKKYGGAVVSTSIDKFIHITAHQNFEQDKILLKYSKTENVKNVLKIKNSIARSIITDLKITGIGIETMGDIPGKTGLGSSSAFAVGLHNILHTYKFGKHLTPEQLAQKACETEIKKLGSPIGKQDQYAAAYGGLNLYKFLKNGKVTVEPVRIQPKIKKELEENLLLFYTGITRSANTILEKQKENLQTSFHAIDATKRMVEIAYETKAVLEAGNLHAFGKLLHTGWELKQSLANTISNKLINKYYSLGINNGAIGGKLLGAGGGGFLLFYSEKKNHKKLRAALSKLREIPFTFTDTGSEILFES
ncbi:MAG: GHMP kinase [Patescibacteria group bacterium]